MDDLTLTTERLAGRLARETDAALFARIWGDPQTAFWLTEDTRPKSDERIARDAACAAAHWTAHGFGFHMLFAGETPSARLTDGRFVGWCGLLLSVIDGEGMAEIGWAVTAEAQGRGYATEAATAVLDQARALGLGQIVAYTRPTNLASRRVMAKLGFREGRAFEQAGHPQILHEKALA